MGTPTQPPATIETAPGLDRVSEAMVATASGYFFGSDTNFTDENEEEFRKAMLGFYQSFLPETPLARPITLGGGLLAAGFRIEINPLVIDTPDERPEDVLDSSLFLRNWRRVSTTVLDMGIAKVIEKGSNEFDQQTLDFLAGDFAKIVDNGRPEL